MVETRGPFAAQCKQVTTLNSIIVERGVVDFVYRPIRWITDNHIKTAILENAVKRNKPVERFV